MIYLICLGDFMGQQESNNSNDILWDIRDYLDAEKKTLKDI